MQEFIQTPNLTVYKGVTVDKNTVLGYAAEGISQTVKGLKLHSVQTVKGEGYESRLETTIDLSEGDVLIFAGEDRGYIKPIGGFCTIDAAIIDLGIIKGGE